MSSPVAGIDPHQDQFTLGIVDHHGVEIEVESFPNSAVGYVDAIDLLTTHGVEQVGIEGSASWGAHIAIAVVAAGFDAREVPPQRTALQRRSRRLEKTDQVDSISAARALLAEPTLGPAQALEIYDPFVAKIEAVLEHRQGVVATRTLMLHFVQDQLTKLPTEIRDQLATTGKIESRLRRLETIDLTRVSTSAGKYRLSWLLPLIEQDREARRLVRRTQTRDSLERDIDALLDEHGTTLRDENGIGPISAATLVCQVADGNRRIKSVLYIASITQQRDHANAQDYIARKISEGKTRREARRAHKRQLANRVIRRMWKDEQARNASLTTAA